MPRSAPERRTGQDPDDPAARRGHGPAGRPGDPDTAVTPMSSSSMTRRRASEQQAQDEALGSCASSSESLGLSGPDPKLEVDAALRPEARTVRWSDPARPRHATTERWSLVWEAQACCGRGRSPVTRARRALGGPRGPHPLARACSMPVRSGRSRTLKARMEAERLPRGADRKTLQTRSWGTLAEVLADPVEACSRPPRPLPSTLGAPGAQQRGRPGERPGCGREVCLDAGFAAARNAGAAQPRAPTRCSPVDVPRRRRHRAGAAEAGRHGPGVGGRSTATRDPSRARRLTGSSSVAETHVRAVRRPSRTGDMLPVLDLRGRPLSLRDLRGALALAEFDVEAALSAVAPTATTSACAGPFSTPPNASTGCAPSSLRVPAAVLSGP